MRNCDFIRASHPCSIQQVLAHTKTLTDSLLPCLGDSGDRERERERALQKWCQWTAQHCARVGVAHLLYCAGLLPQWRLCSGVVGGCSVVHQSNCRLLTRHPISMCSPDSRWLVQDVRRAERRRCGVPTRTSRNERSKLAVSTRFVGVVVVVCLEEGVVL